MDLTHQFHVPTDLDKTWAHFQDVAGLAGCFPGAQVTAVDGDEFTGSCKVKLGPIALVYNGTGTFTERDESTHRLVVDAKGKDRRGNGTAAARATLTMCGGACGGTDVQVLTGLAITGKPAQFGRGLFQDVSDKLLGQFVACLQQQLSQPEAADPDPAVPPAPTTNGAVVNAPPASSTDAASTNAASSSPTSSSGTAPLSPTAGTRAGRSAPPPQVEALDLGAAVLPVLVRSYWKPAVAGLITLAVIIRLIRR